MAAVAVVLPLAAVTPVQAADVKDQSQEVITNQNTLRTPMAQTFTPAISGQLDRLTLRIAMSFGSISMNVAILSTSGGKPYGSPLGSTSFTGSVNPAAWHDFIFSPTVAVSSGTMYAIVVTPKGYLTWYDNFSVDTYTRGQMWLSSGGGWIYQTSFGRDFAFDEWVISGNVNQPPAVTEKSNAVSVPEGSTATNSGTYSDPDGDNVALSASAGTLTKTGTSSGTWTWTQSGADESPVQQVTITADDGHGARTPVMFNVTVTPVAPAVTIVGAPSTGLEGTSMTLTANATSPSAADQAAGFTYSWTVNKNNAATASAPVTGSTFKFAPDDEGTFVVTLTAVDDGGNGASVTTTITGTNVAPTAEISSVTHSGIVLLPLTPITFQGGFTDPGALDTHTATFDYGDGSPVDTTTYSASGSGDTTDTYSYAAPGTYAVTYTVTDDDGGTSSATVKVTVQTPAAALGTIAGYVATLSSLDKGQKNSLTAKYNAAAASAARGDTNATCGQLGAVLNDLAAMTKNGELSQSDSDVLASATWSVHRALGCTQVKVAWLNLSL
ncbi:MAG TPA: PKD domain-containing protein [Candidatus Dormibacteraeota bacterium]|nr:PKD domain-containing protein [Candidatus Dormibacteraeota bacterium]